MPTARSRARRPLTFENGEAKATGIVTYPGGDRVDWKLIELPEKQRGTLDFKLTVDAAAPGPAARVRRVRRVEHADRHVEEDQQEARAAAACKTAKLDNAKGKYFVRVYAVGRGDAGKYKLTVEFKETSLPVLRSIRSKLEIPEPPKLAAVPEAEVPCDDQFDPKNPLCKNVCPEVGAPPGWPPCKGECPTPPDVEHPVVSGDDAVPEPAAIAACGRARSRSSRSAIIRRPDPQNPNCDDATADPVTARVLKNEVQGSELVITIGAGSEQGIAKGWNGHVLRGDTDSPLLAAARSRGPHRQGASRRQGPAHRRSDQGELSREVQPSAMSEPGSVRRQGHRRSLRDPGSRRRGRHGRGLQVRARSRSIASSR